VISDFYCIEVLSGKTSVEKVIEIERVITNLGEYQDSKHLHWHVVYGKRI